MATLFIACGQEEVEWLRLREWFEYDQICFMGECGVKLRINETQFFENAKFWFSNCVTKNEFYKVRKKRVKGKLPG